MFKYMYKKCSFFDVFFSINKKKVVCRVVDIDFAGSCAIFYFQHHFGKRYTTKRSNTVKVKGNLPFVLFASFFMLNSQKAPAKSAVHSPKIVQRSLN